MHPGSIIICSIFLLPLLVVGGFFLIWILKIITAGPVRRNDPSSVEETRLIQELHQGLLRMEERIEALETILLDPDRKDSRK